VGGGPDTDGADGADGGTADGADGTTGSPWAGDYTGTIDMTFPGRVLGFNACDGALTASIDADDGVTGSFVCGTGGDPDALTGTLTGRVVSNEPAGSVEFDGDLSDNSSWTGFVVDASGGTLTGSFSGTAVEASVGNQGYSASFTATR